VVPRIPTLERVGIGRGVAPPTLERVGIGVGVVLLRPPLKGRASASAWFFLHPPLKGRAWEAAWFFLYPPLKGWAWWEGSLD
jgi:hypothetical protein